MSSVFYNGRLLISPTVASRVDNTALLNTNLSVGNVLALLGSSSIGAPKTPIVISSPSDAYAKLGSGDLADACAKAFSPSSQTGSPAYVVAVRVNPAVQASLVLRDAANTSVLTLTSSDYGSFANSTAVKIEPATTQGLKISVLRDTLVTSQDNVYRNMFSVAYNGAAESATISVTGTSLVLSAPSTSPVATLDLTQISSVDSLVSRINAVPGFAAATLDGNGARPVAGTMDFFSSLDVKTSQQTITANLQAVVDYFNSPAEPYVLAARQPNAGTPPAAIAYTYLTGGLDGSATNQDWSDAFTALQSVDCQWVTPLSANGSIQAMANAHCVYMSNVAGMERRAICGTASATTDANAIVAAKSLNSDRTGLVHLGYYDYDKGGNLILRPPYMTAALIAAMFAGSNPGEPMTNKSLSIVGIERNLRNPADTDALITGGIIAIENKSSGFRVVQSVSTWLNDEAYDKVELSVGAAVDYVARSVRNALEPLKGQKASPILLGRAVNITESTLSQLALPEPQGIGVLVGDAKSPAYKGITASLQGDVVRVQFQCSPVLPANYILVSIFAVPYSGTATA